MYLSSDALALGGEPSSDDEVVRPTGSVTLAAFARARNTLGVIRFNSRQNCL